MFLFRDFTLSSKREVRSSIKYVYGVGWCKSNRIANMLGLSNPYFSNNLNQYAINVIIFLLKGFVITDSKIKKFIENNISRLYNNGSLRGARHRLCLPVRGQRSKTNASTQRNKRINYTVD